MFCPLLKGMGPTDISSKNNVKGYLCELMASGFQEEKK